MALPLIVGSILLVALLTCGRVLHARHYRLKRIEELRNTVRHSSW